MAIFYYVVYWKCPYVVTLGSGIDVGQGINVGHEQNVQRYDTKNISNLKIFLGHGRNSKI